MASHHYPDPHSQKPSPPPAASQVPGESAASAKPDGGAVDEAELQARLEKRNDVFGNPMQQRRHQTALIVKKTELSPGEKAAMGRSGTGKRLVLTLVILAVVGAGIGLVYSPLLAPPPPPPPPPPIQPPPAAAVENDPAPRVPAKPLAPPKPPAFAPLQLVFAGQDGAARFDASAARVAGWTLEKGLLVEPPRPAGAVTWLKEKYTGDLDIELQIAVDSLADATAENAREFRVVFGDRLNNTLRVVYHAPSVDGNNWAEVLDDTGAQTAVYGHNRYGWPFESDVFYRLKISRRGPKWMISRDGEFMFSFFYAPGTAPQIGYVPVTGAKIQSIQVLPK
ncbi:MAG TPA: hypothetical protein VL860_12540 [Planctomycetota bacterium]|nr:hypothetical protein [Planctomycetota bacterium]